jgi:hypothetical protein
MPLLRPLAAVLLVVAASPAVAATVTSVFSGRIPCVELQGVQLCAGSLATRIESFDGVPLDTNVTLPPASMTGPFPLIVDLHGWSLGKNGAPYVAWAQAGYAVLSYTARGFHLSCGNVTGRAPDASLSNPNVCAERGWIRLADARYEAHDTQHLAGLLADEGLVVPDKIGVTGASYGGGQSMILAALRDRVLMPDGTLVPWKSPGGLDMTIAAAAPLIPWSDLAYSLTPNGRNLDYRDDNPFGNRGGVQKQSWNAALYNIGNSTGFYSPPGVDFASDIQSWNARINQGEPYEGDPVAEAIRDEITSHHSAYYVDDSVPPAPLFIYNAWTDDLFPVDEALRFWRKTVTKHPGAEIALRFADDFGHSRAGLGFTGVSVIERVTAFFARHLKGQGDAFPKLETYTQGCNGAAVEGPFTADHWDALHPGEVRFEGGKPQRFANEPGSTETARATDPLNVIGPCRTSAATDDEAAATYRLPQATGDGYTLLGSPTVIAQLAASGPNAQVVGRLWDVAPDGTQTLVAQGVYRPRSDNRGRQVFQLHPNAWRFAAGHVPKLELLGQSAGYLRPSNGAFTVTVSDLELRLPVREAPGGKVVQEPAPPVLPHPEVEPIGCALAPRTDCRPAVAAARVSLTLAAGRKPRLDWRWRSVGSFSDTDAEDPVTGSSWRLCLYDGAGGLLTSALAPGASTCGRRPCWKETGTGFRYHDFHASTGVTRLDLRAVSASVSTATVLGRGAALGVPSLPAAAGPLTAQLVTDVDCWSTSLADVGRNTSRMLKAKRE